MRLVKLWYTCVRAILLTIQIDDEYDMRFDSIPTIYLCSPSEHTDMQLNAALCVVCLTQRNAVFISSKNDLHHHNYGWCMILYHMLRVVKIMITNINCIDRRKIFWQSKGFLRLSQLPRKTSWSGEIWCDYYNYSTMKIRILIACKSWQLRVTLANDTILIFSKWILYYIYIYRNKTSPNFGSTMITVL